jgi:predicted ABC-type ATPase
MNKKVRVILGPNGSGKSTLKKLLSEKHGLDFGFFINADDIQRELSQKHKIKNTLNLTQTETIHFLRQHTLNTVFSLTPLSKKIKVTQNSIAITKQGIGSYEAAALADLFRTQAAQLKMRFSYETVFSDHSKIDFIKFLKNSGYKIYLYVVATINPEINISRVKNRVKNNGHSVPEDKIVTRYHKSLVNMSKVIPWSDRCFIIDNSQNFEPVLVAEITSGKKVTLVHPSYQPTWVQKVLRQKS